MWRKDFSAAEAFTGLQVGLCSNGQLSVAETSPCTGFTDCCFARCTPNEFNMGVHCRWIRWTAAAWC